MDRRSQWLDPWAPGESAACYFLTQTNSKFALEIAEAEASQSPLKDGPCHFLTLGASESGEAGPLYLPVRVETLPKIQPSDRSRASLQEWVVAMARAPILCLAPLYPMEGREKQAGWGSFLKPASQSHSSKQSFLRTAGRDDPQPLPPWWTNTKS